MKDNQIISQIHLTIPEGKELNISTKVKGNVPYHFSYGNGMNNKRINVEPIDAIEQFETFTPQEWYVFKLLKQEALFWDIDIGKYVTTCKVQIDSSLLNVQDRNKFTIGYKRLESKSLVKRIKRGGHYMINPNLLIPTRYTTEQSEWIKLINKENT